jgi:pimeloyl-ACP methyl ester carboxylesterase
MTVRETRMIDLDAGDRVAATIHFPSDPVAGPCVVAFGLPGGGLARGYFDARPGGDDSYSQAAFHTSRGWIFVALDHLGVGDSSQPSPETLTYASLARGDHEAVTRIADGLRRGSLVDGIGPVDIRGTIGLGHSMGGCIAIVAQGTHATFDALGVLGFSAVQTTIPTPSGALDVALKQRDDSTADLESGIAEAGGAHMFRWAFYWEDVPDQLIDRQMGGAYPGEGIPPWNSATTPPVVFSMISPGVVADEAAAIGTPVLVATGERDVVPDLRAEAVAYRSCPHLTIVEVPAMAHMHNFAGTRGRLWSDIHRWGECVLP